jgi:hypothetical protein
MAENAQITVLLLIVHLATLGCLALGDRFLFRSLQSGSLEMGHRWRPWILSRDEHAVAFWLVWVPLAAVVGLLNLMYLSGLVGWLV